MNHLTSYGSGPDHGVASPLPFGGVPLPHLLNLNRVARSAARGVRQTMRRIHTSIVLGMTVLIGCATRDRGVPPPLQSTFPVVSSQAFSAVIDPRLVNFANSWTPTEEQVLLAEPKVQAFVLSRRPGLCSTLSRYLRHYSGWTVNGQKALRIQFFDTQHFSTDELARPLEVMDGDGVTYFVVSFDLASGTCSF